MRRVAAVTFVMVLVAGACGDDGSGPQGTTAPSTTATTNPTTTSSASATQVTTTTTGPAELKPSGGTLEYVVENFTLGLSLNPYLFVDPNNDGELNPALRFGRAYLGGVVFFNADSGELEPDLVTVLPSLDNGGLVVNADGTMTVRYEIAPDAEWSDGMPISGEDFEFTYEVVTETMARLEAATADDTTDEEFFETCGHLEPISVFGAEVFSAIDPGSVSAGAKTFTYTLTETRAYNADLFAFVVPRHAVEGTDFLHDWHVRMWPSAGPFVVESLDVERYEVTMVRNDDYWRTDPDTGQQLPYLDKLVLTVLEDEYLERLPAEFHEIYEAWNDCRDAATAAVLIGLDLGSRGSGLFGAWRSPVERD